MVNAGPALSGRLRTTVEDAERNVVATLDDRAVALQYGESLAFSLPWNVGHTYAGAYAFRVHLVGSETEEELASDAWPFVISPDRNVGSRLVAWEARILSGSTALLEAHAENRGANAPLVGASARVRIRAAGTTAPILFEQTHALSTLLPGGEWTSGFSWLAAVPSGLYEAELDILQSGETVLSEARATVEVVDGVLLSGSLKLRPADIVVGTATDAEVVLTNRLASAVSAVPLAVEVINGPTGAVLVREELTVDLAASGTEIEDGASGDKRARRRALSRLPAGEGGEPRSEHPRRPQRHRSAHSLRADRRRQGGDVAS